MANAYQFYNAVEALENNALASGDAYFYARGYGDDGSEFCIFQCDAQGGHASCETESVALESAAVAEVRSRATENEIYAVLRAGCQNLLDYDISCFQLLGHVQESYV